MKSRSLLALSLMLWGGVSIPNAADMPRAMGSKDALQLATFAGGCFWCMEPPFEKLPGVVSVISGYAGGMEKDPTYEQVSNGKTGHAEVVQIRFDPAKVTYAKLLDVFWHNIDPTTLNRSFVDAGKQYRSAIFYHDETQKTLALESKRKWDKAGIFGKPIVTAIEPLTAFYAAEEYHQDFYKKNPDRYHSYRNGSGRDPYLRKIWGKQDTQSRAEK